jgi:AI-2 transport protein TqsA
MARESEAKQRLPRRVSNGLWTLAALVVVVYGLKAAAPILVPVTVAIMLAIICSPAVKWLERKRIPNLLAVLAVVGGVMLLIAGLGVVVGGSLAGFRDNVPRYQGRIEAMFLEVSSWLHNKGWAGKTDLVAEHLRAGSATGKAANFLADSIFGIGAALSNTLLVVLTMILMLLEAHTVPGKLRLLSRSPSAGIEHFRRIAVDVQNYLAIKTVLSIGTGAVVGISALVLDIDFAILWALLAFLLNFIPNIGSIIAAVPAVLLAFIQQGATTALLFLLVYVAVNMVIGNVLEPMWMGKRLGLSTTVVFLSLLVWGEIWGTMGMLLSVPLTMVLKIMLENSRDYAFVAELLSEEAKADSKAKPPPAQAAQP